MRGPPPVIAVAGRSWRQIAPNGTGKSTIAEAVRAALWGAPVRPPRQPWEPVDRAAGAAEAWVEVLLSSGTSEMRCRWSDASTPPATAQWADARTVSVADPDWQAALAAFSPVFSYTETQDRLSTSKDLEWHLEDLLALGPWLEKWRQARRAIDRAASRLAALYREQIAPLVAAAAELGSRLPIRCCTIHRPRTVAPTPTATGWPGLATLASAVRPLLARRPSTGPRAAGQGLAPRRIDRGHRQ